MEFLKAFLLVFCIALSNVLAVDTEADTEINLFQIEGKVVPPDPKPKDWHWTTKIYLDGGKRLAYIKVMAYTYKGYVLINYV